MTVIPGTPGTKIGPTKAEKSWRDTKRDVNRLVFPGKDSMILLFVPYLHIFIYIRNSRGQILRTSFGKDQPSQRGCSKYHLEHQEKPYT